MTTTTAAPFLTLPVGISARIIQSLTTRDRIALVSTCSTLYRNANVAVWYDALCALKKKRTVVCLPSEFETLGMAAYQPFVVTDIVRNSEANSMTLVVYCPKFFPGDDGEISVGDIMVNKNDIWVQPGWKQEEYPWNSCSDEELKRLDWHTHVQGKIQRMTGAFLRKIWGRHCPECCGGRSICPGCGGVSGR